MKITDKYVLFWKEDPMCNFTHCRIKFADPYFVPLEDDALEFSSSEQLFMWFKAIYFGDHATAEKILNSRTPEEARKLGRQVQNYDDIRWNKVRVDYMRKAVHYKFMQNPELQEKLLDARYDGKTFVEAAYYDRIWGIGYDENTALGNIAYWGRNELGKILTDIRNKLKSKN